MYTSRLWILLLLFFVAFFLKGLILDPDLGWHLATGAYVLSHGFPLTDPFSYSMPSYPLVAYSWITDIVSLLIYRGLGIPGLAIVFAIVALGSLFLLIPKQKKHLTMPFLLSGSILLFVTGIRSQVISWLLFSLVLIVIQRKGKYRYIYLPLIFLLWANMHGSFLLGLGVLGISILIDVCKNRKISLSDIGTVLLSFAATLINPYGIQLWQETFSIITWAEKHYLLLDWYPGIFVPYLPLWISFFLSAFFLFTYAKQFSIFEKVTFVVLFCVGMGAIVDVPYFAIFNFPLLVKGFTLYNKEKEGKSHFLQSKGFKSAIVLVILIHGLLLFYPKEYPEAAVTYLQKQQVKGNLFVEFNWAGYVLWHLPEQKVFIDGQMTHWKLSNPKPNESANAFQEYLAVANRAESIASITKKYNINTLLVSPGFGNMQDVHKSRNYPTVAEQLKSDGWKTIYQDATAIIYQK